MLSTTLPVRWAVAPQELLPIMPPSVQFMCVAGSGPNRSCRSASCLFNSSRTIPGSTMQRRASASTDTSEWQYLEKSMTTAAFVPCPAREVPPAAGDHGQIVLTADGDRLDRGLDGPGDDHPKRHSAEVGGVGGVGGQRPGVEPDLSVDPGGEGGAHIGKPSGRDRGAGDHVRPSVQQSAVAGGFS